MQKHLNPSYPVLPLRDIVVFPYMIVPLFAGRDKLVHALKRAMQNDRKILLSNQMAPGDDNPDIHGIYRGASVLADVLQPMEPIDDIKMVVVKGLARMKITELLEYRNFLEARVEYLTEIPGDATTSETLLSTVADEFRHYAKTEGNILEEALAAVGETTEPAKLADLVSGFLNIEIAQKQELLETLDVNERLEKVYSLMRDNNKIKPCVKPRIEKTQRDKFLNEHMDDFRKKVDNNGNGLNAIDELKHRIAKTKLSEDAREKAESELKRLEGMTSCTNEAPTIHKYLNWLLSLPWGTSSQIKNDLNRAQEILNADHHGLEKVKERIIEYLGVQQRSMKIKSPIMCLIGPPGVGKTSLAKSVAEATGREFVRISLGGVHDEAEIRGHRRTYTASLPGKIIQAMKKSKTVNPLILLDEIDKMGQKRSSGSDVAAAMLEVLDPEQNDTFVDHYLEIEYDLSDVMFLATANSYSMPGPLLDRMEIIRLAGYTEDEKNEIAKQYLIDKQIRNHGLKDGEFELTDAALKSIICNYTREAGVRNLERKIAKVIRKSLIRIIRKETGRVKITSNNLHDFLGVPEFHYGLVEQDDQVGVVVGLAWTPAGGDLMHIEALKLPGKGRMKTTGKLGDVMKESIDAASSYVRSISTRIGVKPTKFDKIDIHVHVPDGATPKDGPSAGLAMVTSIVSALTGIPVHKDIAMTGEVSLRGNAMIISGLKEKLLAALRGGIRTVFIPEGNRKDLADIPVKVREKLDIITVKHVSEVLDHALVRKPEPVNWKDAA